MKHDYTTETIQAAIEEAGQKSCLEHDIYSGLIQFKPDDERFLDDAPARLTLARELLERLPEPTPPVVEGKTPGQVAFDAFINGSDSWERAASAVLAAFGGEFKVRAEKAEAELADLKEEVGNRQAALLAACTGADELKGQRDRWYNQAKAENEKYLKAIEGIGQLQQSKLPHLRPLSEAGPVPDGCVRVYHDEKWQHWNQIKDHYHTHFADIRLPSTSTSQDSQPAKVKSSVVSINTAGCEPMDDDTKEALGAMVKAAIAPAWTPKVGDTVKLKSGGPVMTVDAIVDDTVNCEWHTTDGMPQCRHYYPACLKPATKEEQV